MPTFAFVQLAESFQARSLQFICGGDNDLAGCVEDEAFKLEWMKLNRKEDWFHFQEDQVESPRASPIWNARE